jgi:hypothetical protein
MTPAEMRKSLAAAEDQVKSLRTRLETAERQCGMKCHNWDKVQYTPIETKGYQTQGDPPGTMGIDWQGPQWIEATCTKQWTRTCKSCGKTETTQRVKKEWMPGSVAGTSGHVEVPDFGEAHCIRW